MSKFDRLGALRCSHIFGFNLRFELHDLDYPFSLIMDLPSSCYVGHGSIGFLICEFKVQLSCSLI